MGQVKSINEFDYYLASQRAKGQFVELHYGLAPTRRMGIGEEGRPASDEKKPFRKQNEWQNLGGSFFKASITIGTFLASD
jgi:hypothetical protein